MRYRLIPFLIVLIMLGSLYVSVLATDEAHSYEFGLTANGSYEIQANTGDIITVNLILRRTDNEDSALMYAMQDEICYDSDFFVLIEGSGLSANGVESTDIAMRDNYRAYYMNFLSLGNGTRWDKDTMVGTFQLKVIGTSGASTIENRNYLVSNANGSDSYIVEAKDVAVIVTRDCTIRFETNGGSHIADQTAKFGKKMKKPSAPVKEGYTLQCWCKDIDLEHEWDFNNDIIKGNMTLYAKWEEGETASADDFPWLYAVIAVAAVILVIILLLALKKKKRTSARRYR